MNHRFGMGLLGLVLMLTLAFGAVACSSTSSNEPAKAVEASAGGATALPSTSSDLPQITLSDGPAGIAGSRFTDPDVEINLTADVVQ